MAGLWLLFFLCAGISARAISTADHHSLKTSPKLPVLFIPPLTGVELDVKLDGAKTSRWWCPKTSDWTTLWISPSILVPAVFSCFVDYMRLFFNPKTQLSSSPSGVSVKPVHFSTFEGTLNPLAPLILQLEWLGWRWGKELAAHIYDWRLSPNDWAQREGSDWQELKASVEALRESNGNRRVIIAAISMGCSYFTAFMSSGMVSEEWKAANIAGFLSVSGVYGGAPAAVQTVISGRFQGLETLFNAGDLQTLMRSVPSLSWLMPHPEVYGDDAIITNTASGKTYSSSQVGRALEEAGAAQPAAAWGQIFAYPSHLPPGVTSFCLYSKGLQTLQSLKYTTADFSDYPEITYVDGDTTVPLAGLQQACKDWEQAGNEVYTRVWENVGHAGVLEASGGVAYCVEAITLLGRREQALEQA